MKSEKLYDAITGISDKYVEETVKPRKKVKLKPWMSAIAGAACVAIIIGAVGIYSASVPKADEPAEEAPKDGDYIGHNEGYVFMSYGGPVFPMTLLEEDGEITSDRHITYNISADTEKAVVTDAYTLTNTSSEDKTVTAVYPFNGNLTDLEVLIPTVTVDGGAVSGEIFAGTYSGSFQGALGDPNSDPGMNLKYVTSWEEYKEVLADGTYMKNAFGEMRDLDQKVTVYKFTDHKWNEKYESSALAISFEYDSEKTSIYTVNINGRSSRDGNAVYDYFTRSAAIHELDVYLIVFGEDIKDYTIQGYKDGSCDRGKEIDGVSATITRYETELRNVVREIVQKDASGLLYEDGRETYSIPTELYYRAVCGLMYQYGPFAEETVWRYGDGRLDDIIYEARTHDRVFYLSFDVTIPAGESIDISARLTKEASFDFDCGGSEGSGLRGYDMVTELGSNLNYTEQKATVVDTGKFEIVRDNFGFDLEKGIDTVTLDTATEHYYMEVRKIEK